MRRVMAVLVFGVVSSLALAEGMTVTVKGKARFWHRLCPTLSNCPLPENLGEEVPWEISLVAPPPGKLGYAETSIEGGGMTARLMFMRRVQDEAAVPVGYVVHQVRLLKSEIPLNECSTYYPEVAILNHVGSCSGFRPLGKGWEQWGISFYKTN